MTDSSVPSRSATVLAGGLTILSLASLAAYTGLGRVIGIAAVAGVLYGTAGVLGTRKTPLSTSSSSLLFISAALALLAAGAVASRVPQGQFTPAQSPAQLRPFVLLLAVFCTGVGITILPRGSESRAIARSLATTGGLLTIMFGAVLWVVLTVLPFVGWVVKPLSARVILPSQSPDSLGSLMILLGGATLAIGALVIRLPLPELVEREQRSRTLTRLKQLNQYAFTIGISTIVLGTIAFLGFPAMWERVPESTANSLLVVSTTAPLRYTLLGVVTVAGCYIGLVELIRRVQPESARDILALLAQSLGGLIVLGVGMAVGFDEVVNVVLTVFEGNSVVADFSTQFGNVGLVIGTLFVGSGSLVGLVGAGAILWYVNILAPRTAGPVLVTSGLVVAAIAAGQITGPSVLLFFVAGAGIVVWDVATYSHRLVTEVGHGSRKLELLHFGAVAFIALFSVAAVYGGLLVIDTITPRRSPAAAIAALLSVLVLLSTLRT